MQSYLELTQGSAGHFTMVLYEDEHEMYLEKAKIKFECEGTYGRHVLECCAGRYITVDEQN